MAAIGKAPRSPERSIWFVIEGAAHLAAAARLAAALEGRFGRLLFYVTADSGALGAVPLPLLAAPRPIALKPSLRLALRRLRARAVVTVGPPTQFALALAAAAADMGVSALTWPGEGAPTEEFARAVQAAARVNPRALRISKWGEAIARRAIGPGLPFHLERLRCRKLADIEALRAALGLPETILCLGSGPSSNSPAALRAAGAADAVFRVKHRWLKEGLIHRADVSFSGTAETAKRLPRAIILAQDEKTAGRMVLEWAWRGGFRRLKFGVVADLAPGFVGTFSDGARLTNGAAMLATAIALRPKRLIVAGIDLYSHPEGAYPGAAEIWNDYAPAHDAARERAFALTMLARQLAQAGPDGLSVIGPLGEIAREAGVAVPEDADCA